MFCKLLASPSAINKTNIFTQMKTVHFSKEAEEELNAAAQWYEQQQIGLGQAFIQSIENSLASLQSDYPPLMPLNSASAVLGVKKLILRRFPFSLIIYEKEQSYIIVALAHHSRKPGYWRKR